MISKGTSWSLLVCDNHVILPHIQFIKIIKQPLHENVTSEKGRVGIKEVTILFGVGRGDTWTRGIFFLLRKKSEF